jgi:uncharacterized damage-inducible protein DinB
MTLGGLVKHVALVEDHWFTGRLLGNDISAFWGPEIEDDPDWEWRSAADDTPAELSSCWSDAVARSRQAVGTSSLGTTSTTAQPGRGRTGRRRTSVAC